MDSPTVEDYKATLGTDSSSGRTLRLLDGAQLNGHYRVGPGVSEANLFGMDSGSSSGGGIRGDSTTEYAITTAQSEDQIAGQEPDTGTGLGETKAVQDDKSTEVPRFQSPVADEDVVTDPVVLDNKSTTRKDDKGNVVKDWKGDPIVDPPAPIPLSPGGYASVNVPNNQTLALSSGVYFFRDEFLVNGGTVTTSGNGPVIIFCGKKAKFNNAVVNESGNTSALQLCFTDDITDEAELEATMDLVGDALDGSSPLSGATAEEIMKNMISPKAGDASGTERAGYSQLEITGNTEYYGSISGANLVAHMTGGQIFGSIMGNIIYGENAQIHQDLALKGSNLMASGGWQLESVHQIR